MPPRSRTKILLLLAVVQVLLLPLVVSLASSPAPVRAVLPDFDAAVIIPGFLTGDGDFRGLADALTARGLPTTVVPMPRWHWIPCLGGRSMRPILERIDCAVRHVAAGAARPPPYKYSVFDCWGDFWDNPGGVAEVGGSSDVDGYPNVTPRGTFPEAGEAVRRVAVIGHSAGGWIGRVYLSSRSYGGKAYRGSELVHSLITLGTPHLNAPGPAFSGIEWINRESLPDTVLALAVAGRGFPGGTSGSLTKGSYSFCCPDGTDGTSYDGDGITTVRSATALGGADTMLLDGVTHFPWSDVVGGEIVAPDLAALHKEGNTPWYGTGEIVDRWAGWLLKKN